jgi:uncharacterized protein (TIGR03067 family)
MYSRFGVLVVIGSALGAAPQDDATKKELARLEGRWLLVALERNGVTTGGDVALATVEVIVRGNQVLGADGKAWVRIKVDPSTSPRVVDWTHVDSGRTTEGIYDLTGETWKVCLNTKVDGVKERPTSFNTKDNPSYVIQVFKRVPKGR